MTSARDGARVEKDKLQQRIYSVRLFFFFFLSSAHESFCGPKMQSESVRVGCCRYSTHHLDISLRPWDKNPEKILAIWRTFARKRSNFPG